jgi:hypothetical protein
MENQRERKREKRGEMLYFVDRRERKKGRGEKERERRKEREREREKRGEMLYFVDRYSFLGLIQCISLALERALLRVLRI